MVYEPISVFFQNLIDSSQITLTIVLLNKNDQTNVPIPEKNLLYNYKI